MLSTLVGCSPNGAGGRPAFYVPRQGISNARLKARYGIVLEHVRRGLYS